MKVKNAISRGAKMRTCGILNRGNPERASRPEVVTIVGNLDLQILDWIEQGKRRHRRNPLLNVMIGRQQTKTDKD
jgi:hypothetical protein